MCVALDIGIKLISASPACAYIVALQTDLMQKADYYIITLHEIQFQAVLRVAT